MMSKLWFFNILGRTIYREPEPAPRSRDRPMQLICPGFPRSATESLQVALLKLGYDYTYHGWDILFEQPHRMQAWCRLAEKKWYGTEDGESNITTRDFDELLGHSVAVTDAAASVFAAEMIEAYPDAKVILNTRRDLNAWHHSAIENLAGSVNDSWTVYMSQWITSRGYWSWRVYERLLWPLLFRATDESEGTLGRAVRRNGKWIYREHINMIRGMVPKERLLEWSVEDGWEPLCKFLDKPVPDEPFPQTNNAAGFEGRIEQYYAESQRQIIRNVALLGAGLFAVTATLTWQFAPEQVESVTMHILDSVKAFKR